MLKRWEKLVNGEVRATKTEKSFARGYNLFTLDCEQNIVNSNIYEVLLFFFYLMHKSSRFKLEIYLINLMEILILSGSSRLINLWLLIWLKKVLFRWLCFVIFYLSICLYKAKKREKLNYESFVTLTSLTIFPVTKVMYVTLIVIIQFFSFITEKIKF